MRLIPAVAIGVLVAAINPAGAQAPAPAVPQVAPGPATEATQRLVDLIQSVESARAAARFNLDVMLTTVQQLPKAVIDWGNEQIKVNNDLRTELEAVKKGQPAPAEGAKKE